MGSAFLLSASESSKNAHEATRSSKEAFKIHEGRKYCLYGEAKIDVPWIVKVKEVFKLIATTLLIPFTLGFILLSRSFRDFLSHKLQIIKTTPVNIYISEDAREFPFHVFKDQKQGAESLSLAETKKIAKDDVFSVDSLEDIFPNTEQFSSQAKQIYDFLCANQLDEALNVIENHQDSLERIQLIHSLAKVYFEKNLTDHGLDKLNQDFEQKDKIHEEFALSCCRLGYYEEAKKFIEAIFVDEGLTNKIFRQAAEEFYSKEELEKALEILSHLNFPEDFYLKIAKHYAEKGKLDEAATVLDKVILKRKEKYDLFAVLAEKYFEQNDLENAIRYVSYHSELGDIKYLFLKIAKKYYSQGNEEKALESLGRIIKFGKLVDPNWESIAKEFWKENDYRNTLTAIQSSGLEE